MKFSIKDIVVLVTTSGEYVGRYISEDAEDLSMEKARLFIASKEGVGFYPSISLCATKDDIVTFNKRHIIARCLADKEIQDLYIEQTSNIKIATGRVTK